MELNVVNMTKLTEHLNEELENNIEDADMDKFKQTKNQYQNSLNMLN